MEVAEHAMKASLTKVIRQSFFTVIEDADNELTATKSNMLKRNSKEVE
jgi:hypothetical protein